MYKGLKAISDFLFIENDVITAPCDIMLVPGGSYARPLAERAAALYHQGMAGHILISGHANPRIPDFPSEAAFLASIAIGLGVPAERVLCENEAAHTFENAEFSLAMIKNKKLKADRVILVCKSFHSRRALLTYQYIFPKETKIFIAGVADELGLDRDNWIDSLDFSRKVMGELERIGKYFKEKITDMV